MAAMNDSPWRSLFSLSSQARTISVLLLAWISFISSEAEAQSDGTYSITTFTAYSTQRVCVQSCMYAGFGSSVLPNYLGCSEPALNECVCNPTQKASATGFISNCVSSQCSGNTVDVTSALSLYSGYCNSASNLDVFAFSVTIRSYPAYTALQTCAQNCVWAGFDTVEHDIGCGEDPTLNQCYCRPDLRNSASSFLSTCVNSQCSGNQPDITSAYNAYTSYCDNIAVAVTSSGGSIETQGASPASSTGITGPTSSAAVAGTGNGSGNGGSSFTGSNGSPTSGSGSGSTSNPNTSNNGSSGGSNSISGGAIAGIVIGSVAALALVGIFIVYARRRRPEPRPQFSDDTRSMGQTAILENWIPNNDRARMMARAQASGMPNRGDDVDSL